MESSPGSYLGVDGNASVGIDTSGNAAPLPSTNKGRGSAEVISQSQTQHKIGAEPRRYRLQCRVNMSATLDR